jgi:serine/threonine protein kinase
MATELTNRTLGKYRIIKAVGAGGMGTIYEGRHESLGQKVAVKVLSDELAGNDEAVKRFIQEGQFMAKLCHNNIVAVYDLGNDSGTHYLAMEFAEGIPLSELIELKGTLRPIRALDLARQVADALSAAHEQAVVHRDIKPDNIMVNQAGKVKVMDFGIAKEIHGDSPLTMEGTSIGTLRYMSPEQCRGTTIDHRSDLFSLGVVLFEMLTGRLPYSENLAVLDLMNKIVQGPFPSPRYVNPDVTEPVENLVLRMTATNPDERYESASELSDDIHHCKRTKAYDSSHDAAKGGGGILKNPLKRLLSGSGEKSTSSSTSTPESRSSMARRSKDRELIKEYASISSALQRLEESKRHQRHAVRRECTARLHENVDSIVDISIDAVPSRVRLLDLSEGGAAFFVVKKLEKESRHIAEIHSEEGEIVRAPAVVSWTRFIEKHGGYSTGFHFVDVPEEEKMRLLKVMAYIRKTAGL